jgi:hypothetical protein
LSHEPRGVVSERLVNQSRHHWVDFALILTSTNLILVVGLFGTSVVTPLPTSVRATAVTIATASTVAVVLAYYSILVGSTLTIGVIRLRQVLVSFLIAATQIGLFLWPLHVLRRHVQGAETYGTALRWWLVPQAVFCIAGAVGSWIDAGNRRYHRSVVPLLESFEDCQRNDRRFATLCGMIVTAGFAVTIWWPRFALTTTLANRKFVRDLNGGRSRVAILERTHAAPGTTAESISRDGRCWP